MKVKIDTKPKFHVISIEEPVIAANMTAHIGELLLPFLENDVKNVVVNVKDIQTLDIAAAKSFLEIQRRFEEQQASFVVCCLQPTALKSQKFGELLPLLNLAPTESEASDIVHMEEIERELMN